VLRAFIDQVASERRPAPAQPQNEIAVRTPVPREIQTLSIQDLVNGMDATGPRRAEELASQYFSDNVIDNNTPIDTFTNLIRNYAIGLHANDPLNVRELAARRLESLNTASRQDANQIAETLHEAFYMDAEGPEEAMRMVDREIASLRQYGENAWEDLIGPMAEDIPWTINVQNRLLENLQRIADDYRRQRDADRPFAKGGPVKKPMMPPMITRRSPELAEMQYRYGGMV
jgi:hypothetical protein